MNLQDLFKTDKTDSKKYMPEYHSGFNLLTARRRRIYQGSVVTAGLVPAVETGAAT
jgi:hypothetical protein